MGGWMCTHSVPLLFDGLLAGRRHVCRLLHMSCRCTAGIMHTAKHLHVHLLHKCKLIGVHTYMYAYKHTHMHPNIHA